MNYPSRRKTALGRFVDYVERAVACVCLVVLFTIHFVVPAVFVSACLALIVFAIRAAWMLARSVLQ